MAQHISADDGRFFQKHRPFHTVNDLVCSLRLTLCPHFRSIHQACHIAFRITRLRYSVLSPDLLRLFLKIRVCLPQPFSRLRNMLHRFLIDLAADLRDQLISQTVSGILIFPVGRILTIRYSRISFFSRHKSGRMICPRFADIPPSPFNPLPRNRLWRIVSA